MTGVPMLRIRDVLAELQIARRTFYTEPYRWLWSRVVYVGPRSPRWDRNDLELFKQQRRVA